MIAAPLDGAAGRARTRAGGAAATLAGRPCGSSTADGRRSAAARCRARRCRRSGLAIAAGRVARTGCSRPSGPGEPAVIGRIADDARRCSTCGRSTRTSDDALGGAARRDRRAVRGRPAMTVVIGTAGHIDHGKTTLLRALTGIDADRLPEERRRGMTIDVGYAHLRLADGDELDFVDVPGHDRLVGNMLVGAGEIDAALLVVAADDGPRAQTLEHLELLDALGIDVGVVAVTKVDVVDAGPRRRGGRARSGSCSRARPSPARRSCRSRRSAATGWPTCSRPSTAVRDRVAGRRARRGPPARWRSTGSSRSAGAASS